MEEPLMKGQQFLGMYFNYTTIIMTIISSLIVFVLILLATRNLTSKTPRGMQNFMEWVIDFVRGIARQSMDEVTAERYVALGVTLFLYIFIANQLGLMFNFVTTSAGGERLNWWSSPTAQVSIPMILAIIVLFYSHWLGMRRGVGSYLKSYVTPHWALLPLNIIEELSKFLSFPLRLFGNIYAGEVLIWVLVPAIQHYDFRLVMAIPLVAWIGYSVFVGAIQAFIFTILTMVYISHRLHGPGDSH